MSSERARHAATADAGWIGRPRGLQAIAASLGDATRATNASERRPRAASKRARHVFGLALVACVVVLWVGSSTLIQYIYRDLEAPFLVTYYATSLFTLYLPLQAALRRWRGPPPPEQLSPRETARLAAVLCPLWFALNYTFNWSLSRTSVASNTILSSTSSLWTLALGVALLGERLRPVNAAGVALSVSGAVVVSLRDSASKGHATVWGDLWCLVSALFYAVYTVTLARRVKDDRKVNMQLVFGFIGLFNAATLWPLFFVLRAVGLEPSQAPTWKDMAALTLNGLFGSVISDYLWARSVLLTTPLIATLALSLTIPLAMLVDFAVKGESFSAAYLLGSLMVLSGFLLVNLRYRKDLDPAANAPSDDAALLQGRAPAADGDDDGDGDGEGDDDERGTRSDD